MKKVLGNFHTILFGIYSWISSNFWISIHLDASQLISTRLLLVAIDLDGGLSLIAWGFSAVTQRFWSVSQALILIGSHRLPLALSTLFLCSEAQFGLGTFFILSVAHGACCFSIWVLITPSWGFLVSDTSICLLLMTCLVHALSMPCPCLAHVLSMRFHYTRYLFLVTPDQTYYLPLII